MTHQMTPLNRFGMESRPTTKPGAKIITISAIELSHKSNYQDFGRYVEADLAITGDAEATLPELIEAVKRAHDFGSPPRDAGTRREDCRSRPPLASAASRTGRRSAGMPARSARRVFRRSCGRRSRTKTGPWCRAIA